jgi:hypothetical protein
MELEERCAADPRDGGVHAATALEFREAEEWPERRALSGKILQGQYVSRMAVHGQAPVNVVTCALFAVGLDFVCAHVCLLKARLTELLGCGDGPDRDECLSTALVYLDRSVQFCERGDHFAFTLMQSLMLRARVLSAAAGGDNQREAREALLRCVEVAQRFGFHIVVVQAGSLLESLNIDVDQGRLLQRDAMDRIRQLSEGEGQGVTGVERCDLTKLSRIAPALEELWMKVK